ncbi:MAG TPA: glutamate--tRNA ligase [Myxococcota bacterium]|nr:glutamate--tRNA ligase [Myxococcota bacterium]
MVRVRIGPSPTGDPHVGTAYIALFNYAFAKKHGGEFILRIEDTDQARSNPAWEKMIIDALHWLGLKWDAGPDIGGHHGPYRQSERREIYQKHTAMLVERGGAYPCFCTAERLEQLRIQQRQRNVASGYDGRCRLLTPEDVQAKLSDGVPHVVRLKVPREGTLTFVDKLRGDLSFENHQVDDQILLKSDGLPTYHLANVVDDHLMGITHVMRAEEWITSTPKHVLLYRGFGWDAPEWIHMPLLRNADKSKISKRKNPVSLNYYRQAGYLPEAMLNYLAMMGWTMPDAREKFSLQDFIDNFTFERISLGGPVFDVPKLTWLNGLYIREHTAADVVKRWRETILTDEALRAVAPLVHERIEKLEDFIDHTSFFFSGDVTYDADAQKELVPKKRDVAAALGALEAVLEIIDAQPELVAPVLEEELRKLCERLEWKTKELFMPVRVAVTGRKATPPLFETMAILGKERCRRRLRGALAWLRTQK